MNTNFINHISDRNEILLKNNSNLSPQSYMTLCVSNAKIKSSKIVDPSTSGIIKCTSLSIVPSGTVIKIENFEIKPKELTRVQITKQRAKLIRASYPKIKNYNSVNFIERSKLIHLDQFDYSEIKIGDVINKSSRVILICTFCDHRFEQMVQNNVVGHGCKKCANLLRWTLERFLIRAKEIYGNGFNYDLITETHINDHTSRVPIVCNRCLCIWNPTISNFIGKKNGCSHCRRWNLKKFLAAAFEIHGNKYNYRLITEDHIKGSRSHIPIICNKCELYWEPALGRHIYAKTGCRRCNLKLITLDRLLQVAHEIHGDIYDFSQILQSHVVNTKSHVPVICLDCKTQWNPTISDLIYQKSGCPNCRRSKGEKACTQYLNSKNILFDPQAKIKLLPTRAYDFMFKFDDIYWLLEFDGIQHFEFVQHFHDDDDYFYEKQQVDIMKTASAIIEGYYMIRIDHTQINNISYHMEQAFLLKHKLYLSTPRMYDYLYQNDTI